MWREQICFVCFHNLLADHLRPSERPSQQLERQEAEDKVLQRAYTGRHREETVPLARSGHKTSSLSISTVMFGITDWYCNKPAHVWRFGLEWETALGRWHKYVILSRGLKQRALPDLREHEFNHTASIHRPLYLQKINTGSNLNYTISQINWHTLYSVITCKNYYMYTYISIIYSTVLFNLYFSTFVKHQ